MASPLVLDANIVVWAVTPGPLAGQAAVFLEEAGRIFVPELWVYEVTSALHKVFSSRGVSREEVWAVLDDVLALPDEVLPADEELVRAAYEWADRLGQVAAYDGFYIALAERLRYPFWTGDQRLCRKAQEVGADFVHCFPGAIGDQ